MAAAAIIDLAIAASTLLADAIYGAPTADARGLDCSRNGESEDNGQLHPTLKLDTRKKDEKKESVFPS